MIIKTVCSKGSPKSLKCHRGGSNTSDARALIDSDKNFVYLHRKYEKKRIKKL